MIAFAVALAAANPTILLFGHGGESCASAWRPESVRSSENWLAGFWSGLNFERGAQAGRYTDFTGMVAEVRLICDKEPSLTLAYAAVQTYEKVRSRS